jgi:hypothetical protein
MDQICKNVYLFPKRGKWFCPFRTLDVAQKGFLSPQDVFERLKQRDIDVSLSDVVEIFFKLVSGRCCRIFAVGFLMSCF